ncbi:hypothetical protein PspS35_11205 [Pseudomonas sp. S35]|nr:hypothetical protein PspS35_11205 [Pseudomonas sp. S35]
MVNKKILQEGFRNRLWTRRKSNAGAGLSNGGTAAIALGIHTILKLKSLPVVSGLVVVSGLAPRWGAKRPQ